MRGTSNLNLTPKRAGGWCEPVCELCESLLEQGTEHLFGK